MICAGRRAARQAKAEQTKRDQLNVIQKGCRSSTHDLLSVIQDRLEHRAKAAMDPLRGVQRRASWPLTIQCLPTFRRPFDRKQKPSSLSAEYSIVAQGRKISLGDWLVRAGRRSSTSRGGCEEVLRADLCSDDGPFPELDDKEAGDGREGKRDGLATDCDLS